MQRFYTPKRNISFVKLIFSILISLCAICIFTQGMYRLSANTHEEQKKNLETALWRSITQCYVIEGRYPESLEYLKQEYGISYETEDFFVDYQVIGENIAPDVMVIER